MEHQFYKVGWNFGTALSALQSIKVKYYKFLVANEFISYLKETITLKHLRWFQNIN